MLVQFARQSPGRAHHHVGRMRLALHHANHLRVGRQHGVGRRGVRHDRLLPGPLLGVGAAGPGVRRAPSVQRIPQRRQPSARVRHQRLGRVLHGVERLRVQPNDAPPVALEQRPGPGGEVLQPRAHREHEVRLGRQRVGRRGAGHADGAHVERVRVRQGRLPGLGLAERQAVRLAELAQRVLGLGVQHAAARNHERLPRGAQQAGRGVQFVLVRAGTARRPQPRLEQAGWVVVRLRLHVLAQPQRDGTALGRVGHDLHGAGEGGNELFGPHKAVEVAGYWAQAVIGRHRAVAPVLDLLQHGVRAAAREHVARQQQQRQPVDVGHGGSGDQVGGARPNRGGAGHRAPPPACLGIRDGGVGHRLLVMGAVGRQGVARAVQRLAHARDVAVAENGPDAAEERLLQPSEHRALRGHRADQRLRHRQAHRATRHRRGPRLARRRPVGRSAGPSRRWPPRR